MLDTKHQITIYSISNAIANRLDTAYLTSISTPLLEFTKTIRKQIIKTRLYLTFIFDYITLDCFIVTKALVIILHEDNLW